MAKNPFGKSRPKTSPFAIYKSAQGWTWHVCKTYKSPESEAKDQYARWFVWASSPFTYGDFEGGDTYARDVLNFGRLVAADPEWLAVCGRAVPRSWPEGRIPPTPAEYLATA